MRRGSDASVDRREMLGGHFPFFCSREGAGSGSNNPSVGSLAGKRSGLSTSLFLRRATVFFSKNNTARCLRPDGSVGGTVNGKKL